MYVSGAVPASKYPTLATRTPGCNKPSFNLSGRPDSLSDRVQAKGGYIAKGEYFVVANEHEVEMIYTGTTHAVLQFFPQAVLRLQDASDGQQGGLDARRAKGQCRAPRPYRLAFLKAMDRALLGLPLPFRAEGLLLHPRPPLLPVSQPARASSAEPQHQH